MKGLWRALGALLVAVAVTPVADAGSAQYRFERLWPALQQPWYFVNTRGLAIDPDDNVFVVDSFNHRIHRFTRDGQLITRFGQFGIDAGQFNFPLGIAADTLGNIFVAETNEGDFRRIQKLSRDGEPLGAFGIFGSGPCEFGVGPGASMQSPFDLIVDAEGNLLVSGGTRIRKFDPNSFACLDEFGTPGTNPTAPGEFEFVTGIGLDAAGRIYAVDGGAPNDIQVFLPDGTFITRFGGFGNGPGQFDLPNDITVTIDPGGTEVFLVADAGNARVQKFDLACALALADPANLGSCQVTQWGTPGSGPGQFQLLWRVQVDSAGLVYTVDVNANSDFGIHRVQKFSADGTFLTEWTSGGDGPREFENPTGLDVSANDRIFVSDGNNQRVQVFSNLGQYLFEFDGALSPPGPFLEPVDVDIAPDGRVYVLDFGTLGGGLNPQPRISRFLADGTYDNLTFGSFGSGPGQFQHATDMAIGSDGSLYVVDSSTSQFPTNDRVQKFSADGIFEREWGGHSECFDANGFPQPCNDGQFNSSRGIAVDRSGAQDQIIVADTLNSRLQTFAPDGQFGSKIDLPELPVEVSVDAAGRIYIVPFSDSRSATGHFVAQVDASGAIVDSFGEFGSNHGQFRTPSGFSFGSDGRGYVVDVQNNRIQAFVPQALSDNTKAIIVTGGGPYPGNALWQATQLNANFTYRTLVQQGFSRDRIAYLSADTDLDLDQNGLPDDVDGDATNANFADAINGSFGADAEHLLIYMVDHGGLDTFRMSGSETLASATLAGWLDTWQAAHPGAQLTLIYDACQSGSFVDDTRSSQFDRVVIASSGAQESAYFVAQGTLSFSTSFWTQIFNGASVGTAFTSARDATAATFPLQNALLEADGDDTPNSAQDLQRVAARFIGNGTLAGGSGPTIGSVSPPQTIATGNTATVEAFSVTDDAESVARVWAVLRPPGFNPGSPDNPVQDLPTFDLAPVGNGDYSGQFDGFADLGTWQIAVFAMDTLGNRSVPMLTSVTVDSPLQRRAVIVAGGGAADGFLPLAVINSEVAYRALDQQGYGTAGASCSGGSVCDSVCDNVCFLGNGGSAATDAAPSLANLNEAIASWGASGAQDLTVYLVAPVDPSGYRLNESETLDAATLDGLLDTAQAAIGGTVTLLVDGDDAGALIAATTANGGEPRILIGSAAAGQPAAFLQGGQISFSRFFFNQVLNGANTRGAFALARQAVRFGNQGPTAQLDDNGNGIANEFIDGNLARRYAIGSGVLLAGDDPLVNTLTVNAALVSDFETVTVSEITTTGQIRQAVAVVTRPDGSVVSQPLATSGSGFSDRSYGLCAGAGSYELAAYVIDGDGNVSVPVTATVTRAADCSDFGFYSGFE